MTLKAAFDVVAAWAVPGVIVFGLDELTGPPAEVDLPCLVPELGGTGGETLRPLGITAEAGQFVVHVVHKLLISGLGIGLQRERFYNALTHIDSYLAVVVTDLDLAGTLLEPLGIADTSAGVVEYGGVLYYGVEFRHRWVLKVE